MNSVRGGGPAPLSLLHARARRDSGARAFANIERWREMSLVQIGDRVRVRDFCGFRCQQGLADSRPMTLSFTSARGVDVRQEMRDVVVFDAR